MNTITLRLPLELQARLQTAAIANHRSVNKQATVLLDQCLSAMPDVSNADTQIRFQALMAIVQKARLEPTLDPRTDNEIMCYDNSGLPS